MASNAPDELPLHLASARPNLDPYGQLLRMLMPRALGIGFYDARGMPLWVADGYDGPDPLPLVDDERAQLVVHARPGRRDDPHGALTSVTDLMESEIVRGLLPVLVAAGDHFASAQLRNAATVGGNVCNASPAGDLLVPLLVLDAEVELASDRDGALATRRLPLADFFTGPGKTRRAPDELLVAVHVPSPAVGHVARFVKFGTRPALDISAISIGVAGVLKQKTLSGARVAFGAVAPTPLRGRATEAALPPIRMISPWR